MTPFIDALALGESAGRLPEIAHIVRGWKQAHGGRAGRLTALGCDGSRTSTASMCRRCTTREYNDDGTLRRFFPVVGGRWRASAAAS
ncbi:MAG: hypothetical protein U0531_03120 [Dehalococcoidia bacterium]